MARHDPTTVEVSGYGKATITTTAPTVDDDGRPLIRWVMPTMNHHYSDGGIQGTWRVDLYVDEAIEMAEALMHQVRVALQQ
jgi:hypothetical protein